MAESVSTTTRRQMLALPMGEALALGLPTTTHATAASGVLERLIAAHRETFRRYDEAIRAFSATEERYFAAGRRIPADALKTFEAHVEATGDADEAALRAVVAHRCASLGDISAKAAYLAGCDIFMSRVHDDECVVDLLASMVMDVADP